MSVILASLAVWTAMLFCAPSAEARRSPHKKERGVVEQLLVKPPEDQEVCFSPDEPCDVKLAKFVLSAQKSLDVAIYDINLKPLTDHLVDLAKRGVRVRVVVDRKQAQTEKSLVSKLVDEGIDLRLGKQRGIMHNKFVIVDDRMVETGSFNYTNGAAFANNENQVYLANPGIVKRYSRRFEELWGNGLPPSKLRTGSRRRDDE